MTAPAVRLDTIERAIDDIRAGKAVVVVDDEDRENEGDLIFAASKATPELLAFTIRYTSGVICVPMEGLALDRLGIPLMTPHNRERMRTAYTISVDARDGVTTGISAGDRAHTIRVLVDSATEPYEVVQPGHVFPLRYREGGVLVRPGHTEASVDLARLAGLTPAGAISELVNDDGTMKRGRAAARVRRRARPGAGLHRGPDPLPASPRDARCSGSPRPGSRRTSGSSARWATATWSTARSRSPSSVATSATARDLLVRVHSECLTGDVFGSQRCDCGPQLHACLEAVERGGPRRHRLPARTRGAGDRAAAQAAGVHPAGRRSRHRRRQPRPRAAGRRTRLRHRRADPARARRHLGAAAHQQPGEANRARGVRHHGGRADRGAGQSARRQPPLPGDQARPDGPRPEPSRLDPVTDTEGAT